ncbi:origin recognition complex subunit 2-domain-containing protein [Crassisporium funariophilum]|nr:origin recognition complex subunit 2-domain-containing protein [Crassisporium funariophilum]
MHRNGAAVFHEPEITSEEEDIDDPDVTDESGSEDLPINTTPSSRHKVKGKAVEVHENQGSIIVQTAFDAYFTYNKPGRVQTSNNVFSQFVLPLTADEYSEAIGTASKGLSAIQPSLLTEDNLQSVFSRYICELIEGFNILCYGLGSKRRILNQFATDWCSKRGHVVIGNGFQPDFSLKDLLTSIEDIPAIQELDLSPTTIEKQGRRIHDFFAKPTQKVHMYVIIHNIDAASLRNAKAKSILALLAHNPRIHIIASIDHINAPLLWSSSETFSRKPDEFTNDTIPSRGFSWMWHDLSTLAAYDFELAFADRSSISGAHLGGARRKTDTLTAQNATAMSETAALHILASVTQKAQKLFTLLGNKQLEAIENGDDAAANDLQQFGMAYDILFNMARENFLATNDTALRSLLGEFRDHSLVVSAQTGTGGGEILWIPLRKERLANVLRSLNTHAPGS